MGEGGADKGGSVYTHTRTHTPSHTHCYDSKTHTQKVEIVFESPPRRCVGLFGCLSKMKDHVQWEEDDWVCVRVLGE